jgi:hypothetical protein
VSREGREGGQGGKEGGRGVNVHMRINIQAVRESTSKERKIDRRKAVKHKIKNINVKRVDEELCVNAEGALHLFSFTSFFFLSISFSLSFALSSVFFPPSSLPCQKKSSSSIRLILSWFL